MDQVSLFINEEPESDKMEFKSASDGRLPQDIWEVITAFSNAEGGTIVLGVRPDGSFEKLNREHLDKLQLGILSDCATSYNHQVYPQISLTEGTVSAYIPPLPAVLRPLFSKKRGTPNGAKVRVGSANTQVDDEWLRRFAIAARGGAETLEYDCVVEETLDTALVDQYIAVVNRARGNVYVGMARDDILRKLRVLTVEGRLTLFGILAFSKGACVQEIVSPTTNIAITHYRGSSKAIADGENEPFETNKEFFGSITRQFDEAYRYLLASLPIKGTIQEGGKRKDYFIIPEQAIREVLANALAHRDYSVQSSRIQVDIYSDRIEFINPGRSLVPIEDLETTASMSRNPILMSFLKDMGYTEQRARGIKTIKETIHMAGLIEPKFENRNESFVATLYSSAFISNDDQVWLERFGKLNLNERQRNALAHLRNTPEGITNQEYRDINGMDKVTDDKRATRELGKLVADGILLKSGENRARKYFLKPNLS